MTLFRRSARRVHSALGAGLAVAALALTAGAAPQVAVSGSTPGTPERPPTVAVRVAAPTEVGGYALPTVVDAAHLLRRTAVVAGRRAALADVPDAALTAYQRSAAVLEEAAPRCGLSWTLLAAVGQVESDHGNGRLTARGRARPAIVGPPLDGRHGRARVPDSDGGDLDGDRRWDRELGPLHHVPSTWTVAGVDGDGNGNRSPQDIDDAALATGVLLCSTGARLDTAAGRSAALAAYGGSDPYVAAVLQVERRLRSADLAAATATVVTTAYPAFTAHPMPVKRDAKAAASLARKVERVEKAGGSVATAVATKDRPNPSPSPTSAPGTPDPSPSQPTGHASDAPETSGPETPTPNPSPSDPSPTEQPPATDDPSPSEPSGPSDPPPSTDPPAPATVTGTWTACDGGWCLDGRATDLSGLGDLAQSAPADLDGDGTVGTWNAELGSLEGRVVVLTVEADTTPLVVRAIAPAGS
jgi:hypothetical protein